MFEYIRHGTSTFILSRHVASGQVLPPFCGPTRTEADFLTHLQQVVATNPGAIWHFVVDNLNTHQSASLVEWVAAISSVPDDLGEKGKQGILANKASRALFLSDSSHRVVLHDTPKHCSWLNQIEIRLSMLVRKLLRRGSFASVAELTAKVLAFIAYYNQTMAKPFAWTFKGAALTT